MSSLLPGYQYDIFISYRQKDNKADGWVTEFVDSLKNEIESTFKEDISIYFDVNPHDGLHDHHDVDDSLQDKLKCLILIPILSHTYCDPECYAWKFEFKEFLKRTQDQPFDLKVKLTTGNVASRILPVKIHEIDTTDLELFESEIGGKSRSIDFIYSDTGVNRPLTPEDKRELNLNKSQYRDQINKLANAIREIIEGMRSDSDSDSSIKSQKLTPPSSNTKRASLFKIAVGAIILIALIFTVYYFLPTEKSIDEENRSIAVLAFDDLSPNKDQGYFSEGLAEEIINVLMQIPELKVYGRTSSFSFRDTSLDPMAIAETLNASHLISGSVRKYGNMVKVQINLIDGATGYNIETYSFPETELENIFSLQSNIAQAVTSDLEVSLFSNSGNEIVTSHTSNPLALEEFFKGRKLWSERRNLIQAIEHFETAIQLDSGYDRAYSALAETYVVLSSYSDAIPVDQISSRAKKAIDKSLELNPENAEALTAKGRYEYKYNLDLLEAEASFKRAISINPNYAPASFWYGLFLHETRRLDEVYPLYKKTIELEPRWAVANYSFLLYFLRINDLDSAEKYLNRGKGIQYEYVNNKLGDFYLAIARNNFDEALNHWVAYLEKRCLDFSCNELDLRITSEFLIHLDSGSSERILGVESKIRSLNLPRDRIIFSALLDERQIMFSEIRNLKSENTAEFWYILRLWLLNEFQNEEEFQMILESVGIGN